ncbi:hypothetical protein BGZ65_005847, partial [Modicella reniformis]
MAIPAPIPNIMDIISPDENEYSVGTSLSVQVTIRNEEFRLVDPEVRIRIQKSADFPMLNELVGTTRARILEDVGFKFPIKKEWLIKEQANIPFRIRVSWDYPRGGYQDSGNFDLEDSL